MDCPFRMKRIVSFSKRWLSVSSVDIVEQTNAHEPWHYHSDSPISGDYYGSPPYSVCSSPPTGYQNWVVCQLNVPIQTFSFHNTSYVITANYHYIVFTGAYPPSPSNPMYRRVDGSISITVNFQNLIVEAQPKILKWDPDVPENCDTTFSYSLSSAQKKNCQVTIKIHNPEVVDNEGNPALVYQTTLTQLCPGNYSFTWDGTNNQMPPYQPNNIAPAGVYTFDILVQGASPYDCDRMRSSSLKIAGHEVNQPTEESTKYEIKYLLNDTKKASQAEVKLYDIDLGNLSSLQGTTEISPTWNTIYLEESAVDMSKGGPYIFLFSAVDDHPETDKAHRQKLALEVDDRKHIHKWKEEHNITPPIITIDKEYVRASNEEKDRIVKITIPKKEDKDKCVVTNPPCSFPNGIAKNVLKVIDGSDNGAGGKFGELDGNGNFVPWDSWKEIELRDDYTYIYYRCPDKPGVISLTFKFDDIPKANDPEKPQRLNPIDTFDDNPATSDPVKLTVWDFTIEDCKDDWIPVFSTSNPISFHLQIKPEADHKGNSLASQIICWLFSSQEREVCKNMRLVDLTGNPDASWQYYWDLQFSEIQSNFYIFTSNVDEGHPAGPSNQPKRDIAISKQPVTDTTLDVFCYDYGAYGLLVAFAQIPYVGESSAGNPDLSWPRGVVPSGVELPSGVIFARVVKIKNGEVIPKYRSDGSPKFEVVIPIDENKNFIADAWQYDNKDLYGNKDPKATDDNDNQPAWGTIGDGISAYDEYRGFFLVNMQHIRTNPLVKDVFVVSNLGVGYFYQTGLNIILNPYPNEANKVTRYDYIGHLGYDQFYIRVEEVGYYSIIDKNGIPRCGYTDHGLVENTSPQCLIDVQLTVKSYSANHVDWIIAHELGHAVSINREHSTNYSCIMCDDPAIRDPETMEIIRLFLPTSYCSECLNLIKLHP